MPMSVRSVRSLVCNVLGLFHFVPFATRLKTASLLGAFVYADLGFLTSWLLKAHIYAELVNPYAQPAIPSQCALVAFPATF